MRPALCFVIFLLTARSLSAADGAPGDAANGIAGNPPGSGPTAESLRTPPPDAAAIKSANALVEEAFQKDIKAAVTPDQKKKVALELLEASKQESGPSRYALLSKARDLAIAGGDLIDCNDALDQIESLYLVDVARERFEAYSRIAENIQSPTDRQELVHEISARLSSDLSGELFDLAKNDVELNRRLARTAGDAELVDEAKSDEQRFHTAQIGYEQIKRSITNLQKNPSDADANLKVGSYRCFAVGNWPVGLKNLSAGSDNALKSLASAELAGVSTGTDRLKLADEWWDASLAMKDANRKSAVKSHACKLYELAAADLTGLQKAKAMKRIAEANPPEKEPGMSADRSKLVGKWVQQSNGVTFMLNDDGTATANQTLAGKWTMEGDGVQIIWDHPGWIDHFKKKDGKWIKYAYQSGVLKETGELNRS